MRLVRISRRVWEVVAICNESGRVQVLDFLLKHGARRAIDVNDLTTFENACMQMLALLREDIPLNGPPRQNPLSSPLGDGLFEFRRQPKGKKLRVSWFEDGNRLIVCALAFSKRDKGETDPKDAVAKSKRLRKQYFEDRRRGRIVVTDLQEAI